MKQLKGQKVDESSDISRVQYRQFLQDKSREELIGMLLMQKDEKIPLSIFQNDLGPLEVLVKYLKEQRHLTLKAISIALNRSDKTIWATYANVKDKHITVADSDYLIPLSVFSKKKLSILESLVQYLKISYSLTYHDIASLIARDDRTIWTVYHRAEVKLKR